jgi:hypothetical protein
MAVPFSRPDGGDSQACAGFVTHFDACPSCRRATRPRRRRARAASKLKASSSETVVPNTAGEPREPPLSLLFASLDCLPSLRTRLAMVAAYEAWRAMGGRQRYLSHQLTRQNIPSDPQESEPDVSSSTGPWRAAGAAAADLADLTDLLNLSQDQTSSGRERDFNQNMASTEEIVQWTLHTFQRFHIGNHWTTCATALGIIFCILRKINH